MVFALYVPETVRFLFWAKKVPQGGTSTEGLLRPIRHITTGKLKIALKLLFSYLTRRFYHIAYVNRFYSQSASLSFLQLFQNEAQVAKTIPIAIPARRSAAPTISSMILIIVIFLVVKARFGL